MDKKVQPNLSALWKVYIKRNYQTRLRYETYDFGRIWKDSAENIVAFY
jgi:hypothetical protein